MDATADRVNTIIVEHLGVDAEQVTPTSRFIEDLGADSLDRIEMMMAAEEAFDIYIGDAEAERVTTVREMVALVDVKLAEQAAQAARR